MTRRKKGTKHILITGFPNYTAVRIIKKLAETAVGSTIHLLIMEKHIPLAEKLRHRLTKTAQKRISIYSGDVTFLDLGLSGKEINQLSSKLTHILHLAHIWELGVPARICREVNVNGTRQLLDFARECGKLRRLAYFSSIYVSGMRTGVIREDEFWLHQRFKNVLEETRFAGERLASKAADGGMPVTIFRLGTVVGDSETGEIMRLEGLLIFIKLLLTIEKNLPIFLPGSCEGPANIVPVNYVIDACLHILDRPDSVGRTYQISDPYPLATRTIFDALSSYLGRKTPTYGIPRPLYKIVLLVPGLERLAGMPKEQLDYFNHKAIHNCSNTLEALKGSGISCPRFETYFPVGIEYARDLLKRRVEKQEEEQIVDPFDGLMP